MTTDTRLSADTFPSVIYRKSFYYPDTEQYWYEPVFIDQATAHRVILHDIDGVTFTLDRDKLEKHGRVYHHKGGMFYLKKGVDAVETIKEYYDKHISKTAADVLGIDIPYTKENVKAAYRKLAAQNHPDTGGDGEKFIQIQSAYESLLSRI